jgi:hypothetical protein
MINQQMLCIVTPDAPLAVPRSITRRLDTALRGTGCVHFATLALLPPPPSRSGRPTRAPELMFEVVVDEGLPPRAAIDALLRAGFAVLWRLYKNAWRGPARAGVEARRTWLRAYLGAHVNAADCGFVGARDRNVSQILAERRLFEAARRQLSGMSRAQNVEREELAEFVVRSMARQGHAGTGEPARRSMWRRGGLPEALRWPLLSLRLGVPALAVVSLLGWLGLAVAWLPPVLSPAAQLGDTLQVTASDVGIPLLAVLVMFFVMALVMLVVSAQFAAAAAAMVSLSAIVLATGFVALGYLLWVQQWSVVWCGAQLVLVGLGALSGAAMGLMALLPLAALPFMRAPPVFPLVVALASSAAAGAMTYFVSFLTQGVLSSLDCLALRWPPRLPISLPQRLAWVALTTLALVLLVYIALRMLPWLKRSAERWLHKLDRPHATAEIALHQVHPGLDACEAALVGRQSHMISLTEIRTPTWWHGTKLRASLRLIDLLAEVVFADGRLGAASGIKFAHWRIVGNNTRLLFCSNYDGAFGGYLDEFIRGASQGVNLIWGCTNLHPREAARGDQPAVTRALRFPPAHLLFFRGCKHEQAFKAYTRASMLPHLHRFEAYTLSLQDIERATRLRDALCPPRTALKVDQVLRALES